MIHLHQHQGTPSLYQHPRYFGSHLPINNFTFCTKEKKIFYYENSTSSYFYVVILIDMKFSEFPNIEGKKRKKKIIKLNFFSPFVSANTSQYAHYVFSTLDQSKSGFLHFEVSQHINFEAVFPITLRWCIRIPKNRIKQACFIYHLI